jgi:predicted tellurium resistance membrane protein TerC
VALLFNAAMHFWFGPERGALEFFTSYFIEKALWVDNILVLLVMFSYFAIRRHSSTGCWGTVGALAMRALFILLSAALLQKFTGSSTLSLAPCPVHVRLPGLALPLSTIHTISTSIMEVVAVR